MSESEIRRLAESLGGDVPDSMIQELLHYFDVNETEVGLEQLCDELHDNEIRLSLTQIEMIRTIGAGYGVTRDSFLEIGELLREA